MIAIKEIKYELISNESSFDLKSLKPSQRMSLK